MYIVEFCNKRPTIFNGLPLRTPNKPPPKIEYKNKNKDITYCFSNRSLVSAKFRAYRNVTFLNIEIPKQCPKGVFGEKIPMARKRKVLAFCLWLNRAGKDVLLGDFIKVVLTCFYKQIVKPGTSFRTRGRIGRLKWRMKCTQSSPNFEASQSFPVFHAYL